MTRAGAGPSLKRDGVEYKVGAFGDWAAIGAERTAGGYQVVWKVTGADQYTVWSTDSQGNYLANVTGVVSGSDAFLQALESSFAQDLNGNGQIGLAPRVVEANGATRLTEMGGSVYLLDTAGAGPSLKRGGVEYKVGAFGDWAAIGGGADGRRLPGRLEGDRGGSIHGLEHGQPGQLPRQCHRRGVGLGRFPAGSREQLRAGPQRQRTDRPCPARRRGERSDASDRDGRLGLPV